MKNTHKGNPLQKQNTSAMMTILVYAMLLLFAFVILFADTSRIYPVYYSLALISILSGLFFMKVSASIVHHNHEYSKNALWEALVAAMTIVVIFAVIHKSIGIKGSSGVSHSAQDALYFSIVTWTTLGYGDFSPMPAGRLFAAIEALCGYIFMALIIGLTLFRLQIKSADQSYDKDTLE